MFRGPGPPQIFNFETGRRDGEIPGGKRTQRYLENAYHIYIYIHNTINILLYIYITYLTYFIYIYTAYFLFVIVNILSIVLDTMYIFILRNYYCTCTVHYRSIQDRRLSMIWLRQDGTCSRCCGWEVAIPPCASHCGNRHGISKGFERLYNGNIS